MDLQLEIPELDALAKRVKSLEDGLTQLALAGSSLTLDVQQLEQRITELDKGSTADVKAAAALLTAIDQFHQVVNKEVAPVPSTEELPEVTE